MNLVLPGGIVIDEVFYEITGDAFIPVSGVADVSGPGSTLSFSVEIPAGTGYTVALTAESVDQTRQCTGSATFDVVAGETTVVTATLSCSRAGDVEINGEVSQCPEIGSASASSESAPVGGSISLSAQASDAEGDPITYAWSGAGGIFSAPTAASTQYTCEIEGNYTLSVAVTDDDSPDCRERWSVAVTCGDGNGGGTGGGGGGPICSPASCDDRNPCTEDLCVGDVCTNEPAAGTCEARTGDAGVCIDGQCVSICENLVCDDDNPCTTDSCDPAAGACVYSLNDGVECPAGDPTRPTTGTCFRGLCGFPSTCDECAANQCSNFRGVNAYAGCFDSSVLIGEATAGSAAGEAKVALCTAAVDCALLTIIPGPGPGTSVSCGAESAESCYCGTAGDVACRVGGADGVCLSEFAAAAESEDASTVLVRLSDPSFAAGAASQLLECYRDECASDCFGP